MKRLQIYLLLSLLPILIAAQSQGGYTIPYQNVIIKVHEDLSFDITEEIDVHFLEQRRGIFRGIPTKYDIGENEVKEISISLDNIHVEDHNYKVIKNRGETVIRIGHPNRYVQGDQHYDISYTVRGAIAVWEDHEEFYWNIIGFDHDSEITKASFSVEFPAEWSDSLYAFRAFTGTMGNKDADVVVHKEASKIVGAHRSPLAPNQGITLAVKIPNGLSSYSANSSSLSRTSKTNKKKDGDDAWGWITTWWNLLPVSLGALLLSLYRRFQRDDRIPEDILLQTHPPVDMSPAEVGTFYDYKVNRRDIISLIPYWGNKGYISISPIKDGSEDMHFKRIKDLDSDAPAYQQCLFDGLFANGDLIRLSDLQEKFYKTMSKTAKLLKAQVEDRELYDPRSKKILHSAWWIPVGILCIVAGGLLTGNGLISAGIGTIIVGIAALIIFFMPPRLSDKGRRYKDHLIGLRDHLKNPVEDKVKELLQRDPQYFHHMYPYVLAFDLDKSWAPVKYPKLDYMPPIWFEPGPQRGQSFNYGKTSDSINVRKIEKVFYSTPPPPKSSGGGSIGGGFSGGSAGGGFGGGSTGSW